MKGGSVRNPVDKENDDKNVENNPAKSRPIRSADGNFGTKDTIPASGENQDSVVANIQKNDKDAQHVFKTKTHPKKKQPISADPGLEDENIIEETILVDIGDSNELSEKRMK